MTNASGKLDGAVSLARGLLWIYATVICLTAGIAFGNAFKALDDYGNPTFNVGAFLGGVLLGAFGTLFFRYDVFVAALAVAGFSVGMQRKWLSAQLLLALAAALKLYPLLLMPLLLILQQRAERKLPWRAALTGGGALLVSLLGTWWLASEQVVRMLGYHRDRPVEFESLPACALWLSGEVTAKFSFGSWNLLSPSGPGVAAAFALLTLPLVLAIYVLLWRERLTPAVASTAVASIDSVTRVV